MPLGSDEASSGDSDIMSSIRCNVAHKPPGEIDSPAVFCLLRNVLPRTS